MTDYSNLTKYIKTELNKNKESSKKCLQNIGKTFDQHTNFHHMLDSMSDRIIRELKESIEEVQFFRKRFTKFISCTREEANKPADDTRSIGYFTYGEFGGEYGYFKHLRKLTDLEQEWLDEYKECCYYNGQPCARWQDEEGNTGEDCECELGREYSSLVLYELDEEEEKRLGLWKQDIVWYLDTTYYELKTRSYSSGDRYYSLTDVKKDALINCVDEKTCQKIFKYDGKQDFIDGILRIYSITDVDDFED